MNLYSLLNIEHTSNLNLPNAEKIENILNTIVTPKLNDIGLSNKQKKYIWQGEYNEIGIKPIIQFTYRGTSGHFFVGTNFKFLPSLTQNKKLTFYSHKFQVFENSEYFEKNYSVRLWNENFFKRSLKIYMTRNFRKISKFLNSINTIEANIVLAEEQLASNLFHYKYRDPNLQYVLAYLYYEQGNIEEARKMKVAFLENNTEFDTTVFNRLESL